MLGEACPREGDPGSAWLEVARLILSVLESKETVDILC